MDAFETSVRAGVKKLNLYDGTTMEFPVPAHRETFELFATSFPF
jgi:hypothetical protein